MSERGKPWDYLETEPALDAPVSDNPSGLYCPECRAVGAFHCAYPEECGGMRLMRPRPTPEAPDDRG